MTTPCASEGVDAFVRRSASSAISLQSLARCKYLRRTFGLVVVSAVRWQSIVFCGTAELARSRWTAVEVNYGRHVSTEHKMNRPRGVTMQDLTRV